jgi:hypothetical protein
MKAIVQIIVVISCLLYYSCRSNEESKTMIKTKDIDFVYTVDEESIIQDSLKNPNMDSLLMLFGEWQLVKICDSLNYDIVSDNKIKFINNSGNRLIYKTDTTHFQNQECYINKGDIKLQNGILTQFYSDDSELNWTILTLNNRQLVITDKSLNEPSTYFYLKMKGYKIN